MRHLRPEGLNVIFSFAPSFGRDGDERALVDRAQPPRAWGSEGWLSWPHRRPPISNRASNVTRPNLSTPPGRLGVGRAGWPAARSPSWPSRAPRRSPGRRGRPDRVVAALVVLDPLGLRAGAAFGTSVATAGATDGRWRTHVGWRRGLRVQPGAPGPGGRAPSCAHPTPKPATSSAAPWRSRYHGRGGRRQPRQDRARRTCSEGRLGLAPGRRTGGAVDRPGSGFGYSVAIGAGTIVVGAPMPVLGTGTAYVFTAGPPRLAQVAELRAKDAPVGGFFGASVAASGPEAVVGDPGDMGGAGRAYVFSSTSGRMAPDRRACRAGHPGRRQLRFLRGRASRPSPCRRSLAPRRRGVRLQRLGRRLAPERRDYGRRPARRQVRLERGPGPGPCGRRRARAGGRPGLFVQPSPFGLAPERRALRALGSLAATSAPPPQCRGRP